MPLQTFRWTRELIISDGGLREQDDIDFPYNPTVEESVRFISKLYKTSQYFKNICLLAGHCVIVFDENAVFYINTIDTKQCSITVCPNFERPDKSFMPAKFATFVCALVRNLRNNENLYPPNIVGALRLGLLAYCRSFETGFGTSHGLDPFKTLQQKMDDENIKQLIEYRH